MNVNTFVEEIKALCQPDRVVICDGSDEENKRLLDQMVEAGTFTKLKREGSYYACTDPGDVARVEDATFICCEKKEDAGPTNNWADPKEMKARLKKLFSGAMKGHTMYVIPYCMGVVGSPLAKYGIEITDSPYVVVNMRIMTRMGKEAMDIIEKSGDFIPGVHSVGAPNSNDMWPCNDEKVIAHFPETKEIWSYGSGYGGNALLGKKCFALRIASTMARDEGWMAEHMLIMSVKSPSGEKRYFAAAFPSACGKTNLAMMQPSLPGWEIKCIGDDIAWMRFDDEGNLRAINPENGFFGVAPGTSRHSNPHAMEAIEKNTIFTNVALTQDQDVWWEGIGVNPSEKMTDWKGKPWSKESGEKASHPNARFTAPIKQCTVLDEKAFDPKGVIIDGIIFGGRRSTVTPLVYQAKSWSHGVLVGATQVSEMTAAAKGNVGALRHDPFAMLPFCGYHMGDYFQHWLDQEKPQRKMPPIFAVNWFRKDEKGEFMWPGYGENVRVLEWMMDRIAKRVDANETAIGHLPLNLDTKGLNVDLPALLKVDHKGLLEDVKDHRDYFKKFGAKFPKKLAEELDIVEAGLS